MGDVDQETGGGRHPKRRRRGLRIAVLVVLAVIVATAVAAAAAFFHFTSDAYLRSRLLDEARANLAGTVSLESAGLAGPGTVRMEDFSVSLGPAVDNPVVSFGEAAVHFEPLSLAWGPLVIRGAQIGGFNVRLERTADGALNLSALRGEGGGPGREVIFSPGAIDFTGATIRISDPVIFGDAIPRRFEDMDFSVTPRGADMRRVDIEGRMRSGPFGGARFSASADFAGERAAVQVNVTAPRVALEARTLSYLPADLAAFASDFAPSGVVRADLFADVVAGAKSEYSVEIRLSDGSITARTFPLVLRDLGADIHADEGMVQLRGLAARAWGGTATGSGTLTMPGSGLFSWRGHVEVRGANLADIAAWIEAPSDVRGRVEGWADIAADSTGRDSISGGGSIRVDDAYLARLPFFAGLMNVLSLTVPQQTIFDSGEFDFRFDGGRVRISEILVSSPTVDITGKGIIALDGEVDAVLAVATSQRPKKGIPVISDVLGFVVRGLQRNLLPPVRVTGTIREPRYKVLTFEPIKRPFGSLAELIPFLPSPSEASEDAGAAADEEN